VSALRSVAGALAIVGLLGACGSTGVTPSVGGSSSAAGGRCPTDARQVPAPETLPASLEISELLVCQVALVERGDEGWWLQLTERSTSGDVSGYLRAVGVSPQGTLRCGYGGSTGSASPNAPQLAFDAGGVLHRILVPTDCDGPTSAVRAAGALLDWQPTQTRWLTQMLPAAVEPGDCLGFLRQTLGRYWALDSYQPSLPDRSRYLNNRVNFPDQVCAVRDPRSTGPSAADLVVARRITDATDLATAAAALDAHPGITGPDPIGWLGAPGGGMPTPGPCTTPTKHPYLLMTGDGTLGYADLSSCLKAVGTGAHPGSDLLLDFVEQLQTSPYEP